MGTGSGRQRLEPARQWRELGRRRAPRRMQARGCRAQDTARLVVGAGRDHRRETARAAGALQQERVIVVRQYACRTVAVPPGHQPAAAPLLFLSSNLEHRGLIAVPDRQQEARWRCDRRAVRDEIPADEPGPDVNFPRQSPPLPPSTMTVSFSGSSSRATSSDVWSGHAKSASSGCIRPWKRSTCERPQ